MKGNKFDISMILAIVATLIGCMIFLVACAGDPIKSEQSTNNQFKVDILFDYDGCRAYRFYDMGNAKYFVRCGPTTTSSYRESAGKTSLEREVPVYAEEE